MGGARRACSLAALLFAASCGGQTVSTIVGVSAGTNTAGSIPTSRTSHSAGSTHATATSDPTSTSSRFISASTSPSTLGTPGCETGDAGSPDGGLLCVLCTDQLWHCEGPSPGPFGGAPYPDCPGGAGTTCAQTFTCLQCQGTFGEIEQCVPEGGDIATETIASGNITCLQ